MMTHRRVATVLGCSVTNGPGETSAIRRSLAPGALQKGLSRPGIFGAADSNGPARPSRSAPASERPPQPRGPTKSDRPVPLTLRQFTGTSRETTSLFKDPWRCLALSGRVSRPPNVPWVQCRPSPGWGRPHGWHRRNNSRGAQLGRRELGWIGCEIFCAAMVFCACLLGH